VQDAARILKLLHALNLSPLPAASIKKAIGEARFLQLVKAQILGFLPEEGPLEKLEGLVGLGSPAMHKYFEDRLQSSVGKVEDRAAGQGGSSLVTGALRLFGH
jgi:hypothetical protein